MNLLCAIGLFTKIPQDKASPEDLIQVNQKFVSEHPNIRRTINVYSFRRYTPHELKRLEERAARLKSAGVTVGNFSQSMLTVHGLKDLSDEALPLNEKAAPQKKINEYFSVLEILNALIEYQGYATRQQIRDNSLIDDKELDKVFRIFRNDLAEQFTYKRPTNAQRQQWDLQDCRFVYLRKTKEKI